MKRCSMSILIWTIVGSAVFVNTAAAEIHESEFNANMEYIRRDDHVALHDSTYLDSFICDTMSTHHIPGLAACIVKDGQIIWTGAYGWANIEDSIPVADTTLFMLASVSKTIVATALMQLYEQGLFGMDDDINDYLPFPVRNPSHPDSAITFRMLLTHMSSINDNWGVLEPLYTLYASGGDSPIRLDTFLVNYLIPGGAYWTPSNYNSWVPGAYHNYCNVGGALLGYLVEAIADSFPRWCQDSIFEPLDMYETSWFLADLDTNNIAIPYNWSGGTYYPYVHYGYPFYPIGQLRTSTLQLARFLIAFMQYGVIDSVRILDSTTVEMMTTVHYSGVHYTIPFDQGLIWYRDHLYGRLIWGHIGGDWGVGTNMYYYPEENSGIVILCNMSNWLCGWGVFSIMNELFNYAAQYGVAETEDYSLMPGVVSLYQNYPNPFDYNTTIRLVLSRTARVSLKVYNILGQKVAVLVNDELQAGEHSVVFDAHGLPSGVYFLRFTAGDYRETKKLLLLK